MDDLDLTAETPPASDGDEQPLTRAERRDQQTQRILDAAKICFVRSGFQGASMQQICAEAGMSPGALYRYFSSKEAIIEAICEADRARGRQAFRGDAVRAGRRRRLRRGRDGAYAAHARNRHRAAVCRDVRRVHAQRGRRVTCRERCMGEVEKLFYGYSENGVERGEIDPVVDLETLLPALMAIAHGMARQRSAVAGRPVRKARGLSCAPSVDGLLAPDRNPQQPDFETRVARPVLVRELCHVEEVHHLAFLAALLAVDRTCRRSRSRPVVAAEQAAPAKAPAPPAIRVVAAESATSSRSCRSAAPSSRARRPMPAPISTA